MPIGCRIKKCNPPQGIICPQKKFINPRSSPDRSSCWLFLRNDWHRRWDHFKPATVNY